jgi:hypothetical protein
MKISNILDYIDNGHMALPEFQRGYVWGRDQVRGLFGSLYRRHPVGGLLVWATQSESAVHRGDQQLAPGVVKLLLDGQQRMTSLYGVIRGEPPRFFDGNEQAFTGLHFHIASEEFQFYQPIAMRDDPLWIEVSALFAGGNDGLGKLISSIACKPEHAAHVGIYAGRLNRLLGIRDIDLHVEEITGIEMTIDVVVDIFNKVNSGGTKLSKGDLALAKICAEWPDARAEMKERLSTWNKAGYDFSLDWLLRSVNTVLTGEAKFLHLHDRSAAEVRDALARAGKHVDAILNLIAGRLGLDHDRVFFGRGAVPVMARYLDKRAGPLGAVERDKLLFWYAQAAMWGRFSGSTETYIDVDLEALDSEGGGLDRLLDTLRLWHGGLRVEPAHFGGWNMGARFYPVLYMLTRMAEARDWGTGLPLKANMLGMLSKLEVHHIFPKARLYEAKYGRAEVNAIANFCFLTKGTNLNISDERPEVYFEEVEARHAGALASQWIPMDRNLWKIENYPAFLEARRELLAAEANTQLASLLHGDGRWLTSSAPVAPLPVVVGGFETEAEEAKLNDVSRWAVERGLSAGVLGHELVDEATGEQRAVLDLAWPEGVRQELTEPVALLIDESVELLKLANASGFRCFTTVEGFRDYVEHEIDGAIAAVSAPEAVSA